MTKDELIAGIKNENTVIDDVDNCLKVTFSNGINKETLLTTLKVIYDYEQDSTDIIMLNLKPLSADLISEAVKYSLTREDLKNPTMLLNIINLIKVYNTLDDEFFKDENVYVSSIENLLDVKLTINKELKAFEKKLSVYFLSLFKSYNKVTYEPLDEHIPLPNIYKFIMLGTDMLTLSGVFSISEPFSTSECIYIENANGILSELFLKSSISSKLLNEFLGDCDGNSNG